MVREIQLCPRSARNGAVPRRAGAAPAAAALFLVFALGRPASPAPAWAASSARHGGCQLRAARGSNRIVRRAVARAEPEALQAQVSLELLKAQSKAGHALKDLGTRLEQAEFEASALDGKVTAVYDGNQRLKRVDIADGALESAGGDRDAFAKAVLSAMQEAHDASSEGTRKDKWELYKNNRQLMNAPLNQIGAGSTMEDPWANITSTDESKKLATELFDKFDKDKDGYWNLQETSEVQMATEGTEMVEESFTSLIISVSPDGGRHLSEEDLKNGLSKAQVIELYTDGNRQRQLGFVLNVYKDHAKVFSQEEAAPESVGEEAAAEAGEEAADGSTSPLVD